MTFHAELSRSVSPRGATTTPPSYPVDGSGAALRREPLYDALHACPTRRLLGWRMSVTETGTSWAQAGSPDAAPAEQC